MLVMKKIFSTLILLGASSLSFAWYDGMTPYQALKEEQAKMYTSTVNQYGLKQGFQQWLIMLDNVSDMQLIEHLGKPPNLKQIDDNSKRDLLFGSQSIGGGDYEKYYSGINGDKIYSFNEVKSIIIAHKPNHKDIAFIKNLDEAEVERLFNAFNNLHKSKVQITYEEKVEIENFNKAYLASKKLLKRRYKRYATTGTYGHYSTFSIFWNGSKVSWFIGSKSAGLFMFIVRYEGYRNGYLNHPLSINRRVPRPIGRYRPVWCDTNVKSTYRIKHVQGNDGVKSGLADCDQP